MHYKLKNKPMRFVLEVYVLSVFAVVLTSCGSAQNCPQVECNCPENEVIIPEKIQLSQLDAASRDRLKSEVLSEIKEETRAEWLKEFEASQNQVKNNQESEDSVSESEDKAAVPKAVPAHLPPTQKIERDAGGMKILRHVITSSVAHRLPVDERDAFSVSESSVYCFVEISAADEEDRMITIKFTHSTGLSQSYSLPVSQSPAWRTWSKLNLTKSMTGTWLCEVFNEDNVLLASSPFVIVD